MSHVFDRISVRPSRGGHNPRGGDVRRVPGDAAGARHRAGHRRQPAVPALRVRAPRRARHHRRRTYTRTHTDTPHKECATT